MTKKKAKMKASVPVPPPCPDHKEVQHRDGKPKWCNSCGWRHEVPAQPAVKVGTPRAAGTVSDAPRTLNPIMGSPAGSDRFA